MLQTKSFTTYPITYKSYKVINKKRVKISLTDCQNSSSCRLWVSVTIIIDITGHRQQFLIIWLMHFRQQDTQSSAQQNFLLKWHLKYRTRNIVKCLTILRHFRHLKMCLTWQVFYIPTSCFSNCHQLVKGKIMSSV